MNAAELHLAINHFPPIVAIAALLILVIGAVWRNEGTLRAGFFLVIFAGLMAVPTFATGDGAADIVKHVEGVDVKAIGPHDQSANVTVTIMIIGAVAAIALLIMFRGPKVLAGWAIAAMIVLTLIAAGASTYTAFLGGKIHHPETRAGYTPGIPPS